MFSSSLDDSVRVFVGRAIFIFLDPLGFFPVFLTNVPWFAFALIFDYSCLVIWAALRKEAGFERTVCFFFFFRWATTPVIATLRCAILIAAGLIWFIPRRAFAA